MQPLFPVNPLPAQESSTSLRKKIVIVIAVLTACGLGVWALILNALRATSGHS